VNTGGKVDSRAAEEGDGDKWRELLMWSEGTGMNASVEVTEGCSS